MSASEPTRPKRGIARRRAAWIVVAAVVALAVGLPTITLGRLQARIVRLLAAELGRPVTVQSVHLELLPWPGVELEQVRLGDAPAFGGEAMATADSARATVRLWALFAGRLEFSSVRLDEANINLARDRAGRWNLAEMLSRAGRRGPRLRPTGARGSLGRGERFPYLEIQDSRVNFKFGLKKEPFYLAAVDGSLELTPAGWQFHLAFSPQRSDVNLSGTGRVTADGVWRHPAGNRAAFRDLGFDLAAHWRGVYLASASGLLAGQDVGVHGVGRVDLRIRGTGRRFQVSGVASVRQLRRWDQLPSGFRLRVPFSAAYDSDRDTVQLDQLGDGAHFDVQGQVVNLLTQAHAALTVTARDLPTAALLPLARAVDPTLPPDLQAQGAWNGSLALTGGPGRRWAVRGQVAAVRADLQEGAMALRLTAPVCATTPRARFHEILCTERSARVTGPDHADAALALTARLTRGGVQWRAAGPRVTVAALAALGQLFGVAEPWPYQLKGAARLSFARQVSWTRIRGWATEPAPSWQGEAFWSRAELRLPALRSPVPLTSLRLSLGPGRGVALTGAVALGGTPWRFGIGREGEPGRWSFHAAADRVSLARLAVALQSRPPQGLWARLFFHAASWRPLLRLVHAQGQLAIGRLQWRGHSSGLRMLIRAEGPVWSFPRVVLTLAGGTVRGEGRVAAGILEFQGQGRGLEMAPLFAGSGYAGAITGLGAMRFRLRWPLARGWRRIQADGTLTVAPGRFPLLRTEAGALAFRRYQTQFQWEAGQLSLTHGRLWQAAAPTRVRVRLQPPAPPQLDWVPPPSRAALKGAWPLPTAPTRDRTAELTEKRLNHDPRR